MKIRMPYWGSSAVTYSTELRGGYMWCSALAAEFVGEYWGFLLIDALNASDEDKWTAMLWEVRHEWTSVSHFTFNCCQKWSTLVIQDGGGGG